VLEVVDFLGECRVAHGSWNCRRESTRTPHLQLRCWEPTSDEGGQAVGLYFPDRYLNLFDNNGIFTMALGPRCALVLHIKSSF
jgi:hypothetical protein